MDNFINEIKRNYKESIFIGLFSFIVSYLICLIISLTVNFTIIDTLSKLLQGSIGDIETFSFSNVLKIITFLMNISVFNGVNGFKFGLLIFAIIPVIGLWISNKIYSKKDKAIGTELVIYMISSLTYSILLGVISLITKGQLLGININFFSLKNLVSTFIVTFFIQFIIRKSLKTDYPWLKATKWMTRLVYLSSAVIGLLGLLQILAKIEKGVLIKIGAVIGLLPNITAYLSFMLMGMSIEVSENMNKLISMANIDLSFSGLPTAIKIGLLIVFIVSICISLIKLKNKNYFINLLLFGISFSCISTFIAYCSKVYLGTVIIIKDIYFGIKLSSAFLYPFLTITILGILIWLIRKMFGIIREV